KRFGGGYLEVDIKALGNFQFDASIGALSDVPQRWRELDGKRVILTGEIYAPTEASDKIHQFQLVYSIAKCCFGGPPKVQERVFAFVPKDMDVPNLTNQFARVTGRLRLNVQKDGGQVGSLYTLEVDRVEPLN